MHTLVAFDKFKSAISAQEACEIAGNKLKKFGHSVTQIPLTDGGEGFSVVITSILSGDEDSCEVLDPLFRPKEARIGWVDIKTLTPEAKATLNISDLDEGKMAILEMAQASGYESLSDDERNAWKTSSYGTGQMIKWASENGADVILLGIGGSATNDCGSGALEALGVCYYDSTLQAIENITPEKWKQITTLGGTIHVGDQFPKIRIACDVDNTICGSQGATAVFGPQKGIPQADIKRLDRSVNKMAKRFLGLFGKDPETWEDWLKIKGTGAAGGIGFALKAALPNVDFISGSDLFAKLSNLEDALNKSDLILTGEGSFDQSSLGGKGPVALLKSAPAKVKKILIAGRVDFDVCERLKQEVDNLSFIQLMEENWDLETSLKNTSSQLKKYLDQRFQ